MFDVIVGAGLGCTFTCTVVRSPSQPFIVCDTWYCVLPSTSVGGVKLDSVLIITFSLYHVIAPKVFIVIGLGETPLHKSYSLVLTVGGAGVGFTTTSVVASPAHPFASINI